MKTARTDTPGPQIVLYGAGGFAREVAWLAECAGRQVSAMIDDGTSEDGRVVNGVPVMSAGEAVRRHPDAEFIVAVGAPSARELLADRLTALGLRPATLVHPNVERSRWIELGAGTVICAGSILTTNIVVHRHVQINLDCTIGHDVVMEDYVTLAPGVHVSGNVHLRRHAYIGTGAVIINGDAGRPLVVGESAVVGAGACVVRSVERGATVVGVPARAR